MSSMEQIMELINGLPNAIAHSQVFSTVLPGGRTPSFFMFGNINFNGVVWALAPWTTGESSTGHSLLGNGKYAVVLMPAQMDLDVIGMHLFLGVLLCMFFSLVACCYSRSKRSGPIECCKVPFVTLLCVAWMVCVGVAFNFYLRFKEEYNLTSPHDRRVWENREFGVGVPTAVGAASIAIKEFLENVAGYSKQQIHGNIPERSHEYTHYVHWRMADLTFILTVLFLWLHVALTLMLCCGWGCFCCSKRKSAGEQRKQQRKLEEEEETYVNNYNSTHATTVAVKV